MDFNDVCKIRDSRTGGIAREHCFCRKLSTHATCCFCTQLRCTEGHHCFCQPINAGFRCCFCPETKIELKEATA